jgi:hypothetical protein
VDVLSLGATKNGAINAEAMVAFDRALAREIPYLMKRGGQVLSKARFVSAQLERYLADDRWLERARQANAHAAALAARADVALPGVAGRTGRDQHAVPAHARGRRGALDRGPFRYLQARAGRAFRLPPRPGAAGMEALVRCVREAVLP